MTLYLRIVQNLLACYFIIQLDITVIILCAIFSTLICLRELAAKIYLMHWLSKTAKNNIKIGSLSNCKVWLEV